MEENLTEQEERTFQDRDTRGLKLASFGFGFFAGSTSGLASRLFLGKDFARELNEIVIRGVIGNSDFQKYDFNYVAGRAIGCASLVGLGVYNLYKLIEPIIE